MKITKILCNQNKSILLSSLKSRAPFSNFTTYSLGNLTRKCNSLFYIQKQSFSKRTHEKANFNDLTTQHKSEVKLVSKQGTSEASSAKSQDQTQAPETTRITTKLLCDLIGCKHYPSNEEISIEEDVLVNVYDEQDKFLGKQSFGEALKQAQEIGKDIILRNDKVTPQVVKIMKYKVELVKRLMKKLGKTVEAEKKENLKYMTLSMNIAENDFSSKENKIKELLAHYSYIRVVVPCDIANPEQVLKSTSLLSTLTNDLTEYCKVKAGPIRQKQKKQKIESFDAKLTDSIQKLEKQDKEVKEAFELSKVSEVNSDADLNYISSVYVDYESLLLDSTGINYEKLLENINLEGLVRGITKTNVVNRAEVESQSKAAPEDSEESINFKKNFYEYLAKGIQSTKYTFEGEKDISTQIDLLEKEALDQKDIRKKLEITRRVIFMKAELEAKKIRIANKKVKKKILEIVKESAIKQGVYNTEEAK